MRWKEILGILLVAACLGDAGAAPNQLRGKSASIDIEYVAPKNPEHRELAAALKEHRALEIVRDLLKPFRLPAKLTIRAQGCDGNPGAVYENRAIRLCYELLEAFRQSAPKETTASGVTPRDAILGPFVFTMLHEFAHALFDLHDIPILGREEDAADQVSGYLILQLGKDEARRLIAGNAYVMNVEARDQKLNMMEFADEHGLMAQRFFNLLCIAYGADKTLFADIEKHLPKQRAEYCHLEYESLAYAMEKLLGAAVDKQEAKKVRARKWLRDVESRPAPVRPRPRESN